MAEYFVPGPGAKPIRIERESTLADTKMPVGLLRTYMLRAAGTILSGEITDGEASVGGEEFGRPIAAKAGTYTVKVLARLDTVEERDPDARISFTEVQPPIARVFQPEAREDLEIAFGHAIVQLATETSPPQSEIE